MAKEPTDAVMRILQLIQKTLAEHRSNLGALLRTERRVDQIYGGVVASPAMPASFRIRQGREGVIQRELKDLKRRVKALEEKV